MPEPYAALKYTANALKQAINLFDSSTTHDLLLHSLMHDGILLRFAHSYDLSITAIREWLSINITQNEETATHDDLLQLASRWGLISTTQKWQQCAKSRPLLTEAYRAAHAEALFKASRVLASEIDSFIQELEERCP